jgi:hypothetical protein
MTDLRARPLLVFELAARVSIHIALSPPLEGTKCGLQTI